MSENYELGWTENVIAKRENMPESQGVFFKSNKAWISGKAEGDFDYSHTKCGRNFYEIRIECLRASGIKDVIPVIVPEDIISESVLRQETEGKFVEVGGEFRTNDSRGKDGKRHLNVYFFAKFINVCEKEEDLNEAVNLNLIYLDGYICKKPTFRKTPFGREISDLVISVRGGIQKDYIPCVAWSKNARLLSLCEVGDRITFYGRMQSRQYFKRFRKDPEKVEMKEVYEVSIMNIEI